MKQVIRDLGFCKAFYIKNDPQINRTLFLIKKAMGYNKEFFNTNIPKFNIVLVYSRKEFNNLWGKKTKKFVAGFTKKGRIAVFAPQVFKKETCWKEKDFYPTVVHEICHLFFEKIRKHEYNPLWLCEGLATYLQHNKKRFKKKTKISYEELAISFNDLKSSSYAVFVSFTDYLIKKYGKEKCIKLLKETYRKKADEAVNRIYGKSIRALIKDANKSK